jgi:hypothetical protein
MSQNSFFHNANCNHRLTLDYQSSSLLREESPVNFFSCQKKTIENLTSKLGESTNLFAKMPALNELKKELRYHTKRLFFHGLSNSSKWYSIFDPQGPEK